MAVRNALEIYVDIVRSLPILALLYLIYFGLPGLGILLSAFTSGTIGLAVIYSTDVAEVLRGGLKRFIAVRKKRDSPWARRLWRFFVS